MIRNPSRLLDVYCIAQSMSISKSLYTNFGINLYLVNITTYTRTRRTELKAIVLWNMDTGNKTLTQSTVKIKPSGHCNLRINIVNELYLSLRNV